MLLLKGNLFYTQDYVYAVSVYALYQLQYCLFQVVARWILNLRSSEVVRQVKHANLKQLTISKHLMIQFIYDATSLFRDLRFSLCL